MLMYWRMPATYEIIVFLILSYLVLQVNRKVETKNLRLLGNLIAVLLWIAALISLGKGVCFLTKCPRIPMMTQDFNRSQFLSGKTWSRPMTPYLGKGPLQQPCGSGKASGNAGSVNVPLEEKKK